MLNITANHLLTLGITFLLIHTWKIMCNSEFVASIFERVRNITIT